MTPDKSRDKRYKVNMKIDSNERYRIDRMAKYICEQYGLCNIPIEPAKIARLLKIDIEEVDFKTHNGFIVSGGILKNNHKVKIYVNRVDSMQGKRFTIAHELGHYFLSDLINTEQYIDLHSESNLDKDYEELKADLFARCLLMPKEEVTYKYRMFKDIGLDDTSIIKKLSQYFYVPVTVMIDRLQGLRLMK